MGIRASLLACVLLVACTGTRGPERPAAVEETVVRPVVVVEHAQRTLVDTLDLLRTGHYRQAEANLEQIVAVRPDIPEAHFNLGWVRQRLDRHVAAVEAFEAGLRLRPDDLRAINLLAISQREAGRFTDAEATYLRGLAQSPDTDRLHLNLGVLYELYLARPQRAVEHYRRYQELQKVPDPRVGNWIALLERKAANP